MKRLKFKLADGLVLQRERMNGVQTRRVINYGTIGAGYVFFEDEKGKQRTINLRTWQRWERFAVAVQPAPPHVNEALEFGGSMIVTPTVITFNEEPSE